MNRIILITNQKGGVGKTTLAIILSWMLAQKKYKTLLVDADTSQANAFEWSLRGNNIIDYNSGVVYRTDIGYDVVWIVSPRELSKKIISHYSYVIVDGRPSDIVNTFLIPHSDKVIIPFMKRWMDLKATRGWINDLIKNGYKDKIILFYNRYCDEIKRRGKPAKWFLNYIEKILFKNPKSLSKYFKERFYFETK